MGNSPTYTVEQLDVMISEATNTKELNKLYKLIKKDEGNFFTFEMYHILKTISDKVFTLSFENKST